MEPEKLKEKWEDVCFHLSENIKQDIKEDFFEQKVLMVLEKLGWHQYKGEIKKKPSLQVGKHTRIEPDLVLYGPMNKPGIVVEVKRPSIELNKNDITQLTSYMRQLKSYYGLLIGNEIHVYYDGNLNPKNNPFLISTVKFNPQEKGGERLIELLERNLFLENRYEIYVNQVIEKYNNEKKMSELLNILISEMTKDKIIKFIRNEFSNYGPDLITEVLDKIIIDIQHIPTVSSQTELAPKVPSILKTKAAPQGQKTPLDINSISHYLKDISLLTNKEVGRLATKYVELKLIKLGAIVKKINNIRGRNYIIADNKNTTREINIIVKSRRRGSWHSSLDDGKLCKEPERESKYWVYVDLIKPTCPEYYIIPDWWLSNNIYETHEAYLIKHGGTRPITPDSKHHSVELIRIKQWKDRWDIMGNFG